MNDQTQQPPEVIAREIAADRAFRREQHQALTQIPATSLAEVDSRQSFLPQSMGEAMQFADIMSKCDFVPMHLRGKPGNCMAIIMIASRWGMDPFAVANKSYFTKDGAPPAFESQLVNAVVNSSGALMGRLKVSFDGEGEKLRCTVSGVLRADPSEPKVKTQSIARITIRNSPLWKSDPEQQLQYYTTRAWARAWTPEVLLGVVTPDEIGQDPENARRVSPPIPRRDAVPDLPNEPEYDEVTGEIIDEETVARRLDSQAFAGDGSNAFAEGPADEQRGEAHSDDGSESDARAEVAGRIIDRINGRASDFAINNIIRECQADIDAMPEDLAGAIYKARDARLAELAKEAA